MFASCYHLRFVPASQPKPLRVHSSYPGAFTGAPVAACAPLRFFCRGSRCAAPRSCSPRLGRSLLSRRGLSVAFAARILFSSQLLSYSIRFYPRKDDLSRGLDRLPFSSGKQPFPRASSGRLFSFHCKKTDAPPAETAAGRHICFVAMKDTKPMKTEWPIITGSDNARRDSGAPDT